MNSEATIRTQSRQIPFSLRAAVRKEINQMIYDGIIEVSSSPHVNPLVIVSREGKTPRICLDARKVNEITIADSERERPTEELLQRFHGAKFMTSLDLTSAFLQIELDEGCRKYTAFLFESKQCQFKRVPFGLKNSLCALLRALRTIFDGTSSHFLVNYVDDLLIYSNNYRDHLEHLDTVLSKLTEAGFTINVTKCKFGQPEVKFLGHIINEHGVVPDPGRMTAMLNYPAPKNHKELRRFLGICNYHYRFIINYASYVAPLLPSLKKGNRWKWDEHKQVAFETLRLQFANSIQLMHPNEGDPFSVYTDASSYAIAAILTQAGSDGSQRIISTASRVLSATERRYTTCEQELLAVVYALQKFRIYVWGRTITIYSDNKALSFLKRCILTSNRVSRWILQLQEYDYRI